MSAEVIEQVRALLKAQTLGSRAKRRKAKSELEAIRATAIPVLTAALREPAATLRREAAELLGLVGDPACGGPLAEALNDPHYRVRRHAAISLGMLSDRVAVGVMVGKLQDSHPVVRRAIVEALGKLQAEEAQAELCGCLKDPHARVRGAAAVALGRIGGPESVRPLVDALRDSDPLVCRWAARSLGQFAGREPRVALRVAIPELKRRLVWWNLESKEAYRLAIRRIEEATAARASVPVASDCQSSETAVLPRPSQKNNEGRG